MQDTLTALRAELINLCYFIVVAVVLTRRYGLVGLAVSRAGSFFLVAVIVVAVLLSRLRLLQWSRARVEFVLRLLAATVAMAAVCWIGWRALGPLFESARTPWRLAIVCFQALAGTATYILLTLLMGVGEAAKILRTGRELLTGFTGRVNGFVKTP
jgi:peptidoglycan biosynthesis protein MviN/MurJ (putative lipid II flippase)